MFSELGYIFRFKDLPGDRTGEDINVKFDRLCDGRKKYA